MSSAYTPNSQTRQQLDELDALLQRMLSLPLAHADGPEPTPPPAEASIPLPPTRRSFAQPLIRSTPSAISQSGQPAVEAWRVELPNGMGMAPVPRGPDGVPASADILQLDSPLRNLPVPGAVPPPMIFGQPPTPSPQSVAVPPAPPTPPPATAGPTRPAR